MFRTITKRLEICIDINIEISEVDHYTWMFIIRGYLLLESLEITFLLNKYFFPTNGLRVTLTKYKT